MVLRITSFTDRQMELLKALAKQNLTARDQHVYSAFAFYLNIGVLKKYGLVEEDGIKSENGRKMWLLTERGKTFMKYSQKIESLLSSGEVL